MSDSGLTSHISNLSSNYVIIVAGGSGSRMKSAVPKQFLLLNGLPVLMHTINAFYHCNSKPQIIVVLPADSEFRAEFTGKRFVGDHDARLDHHLVDGLVQQPHQVLDRRHALRNIDDQQGVRAAIETDASAR